MISFVPESLQADIIESINDLHFLKGNIEEIEFSVFQKLEESADEYDCEISENSMVCLSVGEDDFPLISVREFLDMAKCKAHLKINDAQSYAKSCNEVYFLLDVKDYATLELLSNTFPKKDVPKRCISSNLVTCSFSLVSKSCPSSQSFHASSLCNSNEDAVSL